MFEEVKNALRVSINDPGIDGEIQDLIDACKLDLKIAGVSDSKINDETDPLIKRAVITYCKGHFGFDNPEAERFIDSYVMLKQHLSLAGDYHA